MGVWQGVIVQLEYIFESHQMVGSVMFCEIKISWHPYVAIQLKLNLKC